MSNAPVRLTLELLDRFRDALRHAGAPLADQIESGLSDEQIDRLTSDLGVEAPPELRILWKWGTAPAKPRSPDSWDINPEFELWPPAVAVTQTKNHRRNPLVPRSTIAFAGPSGEGYLLVEGDADSSVSPVIHAFIEDPDTLKAGPSLGALFELWTQQLADGDYRYLKDRWDPLDGPQTILLEDS